MQINIFQNYFARTIFLRNTNLDPLLNILFAETFKLKYTFTKEVKGKKYNPNANICCVSLNLN